MDCNGFSDEQCRPEKVPLSFSFEYLARPVWQVSCWMSMPVEFNETGIDDRENTFSALSSWIRGGDYGSGGRLDNRF